MLLAPNNGYILCLGHYKLSLLTVFKSIIYSYLVPEESSINRDFTADTKFDIRIVEFIL